jgi:gliding motility-associated-like protein
MFYRIQLLPEIQRTKPTFSMSWFILLLGFSFSIIAPASAQNFFFSGNDDNTAFLCEDGRLFLSGVNNQGQLANATNVPSTIPVPTVGIGGVGFLPRCKQVQIEGVNTFMALTHSGDTVLAWGVNNYGQIGDGTTLLSSFPVRVKGVGGIGYLQDVKQIATGNASAYALTEEGKVLSWGYNFYGQLGNGTYVANVLYPDYVLKAPGDTLKNVKQISAGGVFCMALLCDGTVWVWGRNDWGQLGQNNSINSAYAMQVQNSTGTSFLTNIRKLEAGDNYCLAVSNADTLWSWGSNAFGQLGIGSVVTRRSLPTYVRNFSGSGKLDGVVAIAAGQGHTLALLTDHTIASWGRNTSGQLGNNNLINSNLPLQVLDPIGSGPLSDINYVVTGDLFSLARTSSNELYIWGENTVGQLGLGDYNNRSLPTLLSLLCEPLTDTLPNYGKTIYPSVVCEGPNSGTIYLNRHQLAIEEWQQSTDNFNSFTSLNHSDFSISFANISQPIYYRAVLKECTTFYYSPVATIRVDTFTQPGNLQFSATVREKYNQNVLRLKQYNGSVIQWEYSTDNFSSDKHLVNNHSDTLYYSGLLITTYYRVLTQSGVCPAMYSNTVEIRTINSNDVKIYDSFTPNGDYYNDEWVIDHIEQFPDNKVEVYNRWGQLVYRAEHYDNVQKVWKGENNISGTVGGTTLADDTYFYLVELGVDSSAQRGYVVISR